MYVIKVTRELQRGYGVLTMYYRDKFMGCLEFSPIGECKHFDSYEEAERVVKETSWRGGKIEIVEV